MGQHVEEKKKSRSILRFFSRKHSISGPISSTPKSSRPESTISSTTPLKASPATTTTAPVLPQEIHDFIISALQRVHEDRRQPTCSTCLVRDLSSYSLVCKSWNTAATPHMYKKITIAGVEACSIEKKRSKRNCTKEKTRSAKLLRTLTARPDYASIVRELKLPEYNRELVSRSDALELLDMASALVKQCVNLERMVGLYSGYGGWSNSLNQALSTRTSLREHVWMFEDHIDKENQMTKLARSKLFSELHEKWSNLETLVIYGQGQELEVDLVGAFTKLPKLRHLMIANLNLGEAGSLSLQAIPASVESLRLEDLQGLTNSSLVAFAASRASLVSLSLVNIQISRLETAEVMFKIPSLKRLAISEVGDIPYFETSDDSLGDVSGLSEVFSSPTLRFLHWDFLCSSTVEKLLADAICEGKLPSLRTLRAPSDRNGTLQNVCRPLENIALPGDFVYEASLPASNRLSSSRMTNMSPPSSAISTITSSTSLSSSRSSTFSSMCSSTSNSNTLAVPPTLIKPLTKPKVLPFPRSLQSARLRAQKRIERAQQGIKLQIVIEDTDQKTKQTISLRGYMGEVRSKVIYSLAPDVKGTTADEDALVRFERDLIESVWKKELVFGAKDLKEICVGGWNISHTAAAGGKTKKDRSGSAFAAPHAERRKSGTGGPRVGLEDLFC